MPIFIDKIEITDNEVHNEMQHHPASSVDDARQQASHALIVRQLLLEAAAEHKLLELNDIKTIDSVKEENVIETLLEEIIHVPVADKLTCNRYYKQHPDCFVDQKTKKTLPFDMVENHIRSYLNDKGHQAAFNAYIDSLMDKANIVGL